MNLQNFRIEKVAPPSTDWLVFGDIEDDNGNILGTFGVDGTSVNIWWVQQDEAFQNGIVQQFAVIMAQQIVSGQAE
jgi:hypothetical protein